MAEPNLCISVHPTCMMFLKLQSANAFPSTDHPALWLKLFARGAGGPLFDFMRALYRRMQYVVRADGTFSAPFTSGHGILASDSASPMFWLLFMADLVLPDDPADISLAGVSVSHLEHADDIVLFSTSPAALQRKLNMLALWCGSTFLVINLRKSVGMVFGCLPPRLPVLYINGSALGWTPEYTYVGVSFCSTKRNIFAPHYSFKAHQAKSLANATFGLDGLIGSLPPWQGRILYMARVDPHLTHACDIVPDVDPGLLRPLEAVQHTYVRRLLGLSSRSDLAFLFTETGLEPLRYRRAQLLLRFLHHALLEAPTRLVACALRSSLLLAVAGHPGWVSDILHVLCTLPHPVQATLYDLSAADRVPAVLARVCDAMRTCCTSQLAQSARATLVLERTEIVRHGDPPSQPALHFRPYLRIRIPAHRITLTRLVLSDHRLASETLRRASPQQPRIERCWRLCRFCRRAVETPEHALLECNHHPPLCQLRRQFMLDLSLTLGTSLYQSIFGLHDCVSITRRLLRERRTLDRFGRFAFDVTENFLGCPLFVHPSAQSVSV